MTPENLKKEFIQKYFNGDEEFYNDTMKVDDPKAWAHQQKYYQPTVHWKDIDLHAKCHPEHHEIALSWIKKVLGYIPDPQAYMPYLAFIQSLLHSNFDEVISDEKFVDELCACVQQIRNKDIQHGGWLMNSTYDESHYRRYENVLRVYQQGARERLSRFLGYEPGLKSSLEAEIHLRYLFAEDFFRTDMPFCDADYKAATIVRYREIFLQHGDQAADSSPMAQPYELTFT